MPEFPIWPRILHPFCLLATLKTIFRLERAESVRLIDGHVGLGQ